MVLKATVILGLLLAICVKLGAHPVYYMDQGLTAKSSRLEKLEKLVYHELHAFQSRVNSLDLTLSVSLECEACRFGAELIHILFTQNITEKEVVYLVSEVCNVAKIESTRVCQAVALEFKDEFFYVADNLVLTPDEICGTLIGTSCGHPYNPTTFWNITLPATPKPPIIPPKPPKKGAPISRVLHLADIHYDRDYMTGSNTECGEPLCCRSNDGPPAPSKPGAGKYGDYNNCDAPRSLIENAFQHLSKNEKFDYIIMTGDLPAHNIWNQSRSDQLEVLKEITDMLLKYFPGVKVYPAVGNHESSPVNSFPPPSISNKDLSISWLYNAFAYQWVNRTGWLPSDTVADIKK
ncbi:sphingomyelin phosphodiesterase-like [Saccoglossus kowalevskii]|uniref:Sphingomyelin phosphodiesterase-like n=1 Tax=Saccoglossus kowalevskii TaxID=10224 RepID=A0ABM0MF68_SACKO|nr:PREDICTED: sphingomyelin phosphodiesterase-like [Saccoglossus kowalevskii]